MRYLVVDDHAGFRSVLKATVMSPADQCREVSDGAEALAAYREFLPDWVFMDIEMRAVDGFEAVRRIRREFPTARVCMVTNHDDPNLRTEAKRAGAVAYLRKDNLLMLPGLLKEHSVHIPPPQ
jgi:CheY-like chemotaxis protein